MRKTSLRVPSSIKGSRIQSGIAGDGTRVTTQIASLEGAVRVCRRPLRVRSSIKDSKIQIGKGVDGTTVTTRVASVEGAVRACRRLPPVRKSTKGSRTQIGKAGRARREVRNRDSSESVRRGSRVQDATPGPQFEQGEEQNRSRQRGNRRDDAGRIEERPLNPSRNLYQDSSPGVE